MAYPGRDGTGAQIEEPSRLPSLRHSLRSTFKALSDWGDNFERNHFDGDFLGTVSSAPRKVGERASRIGEELGSATVKLVEEATGKVLAQDGGASGASGSDARAGIVLGAATAAAAHDAEPWGAPQAQPGPPAAGARSLWEEVQQLQAELAKEREMRRGRVAALSALDEAQRNLRAEILEERQLLEGAEGRRLAANGRSDTSEQALEEIQEEHHSLLSRRASQEADLRRQAVALAAAEKAAREAIREGAWAREGPETEALKEAKVLLAEVLGTLDEVRLQGRREAAALQQEIDSARAEAELLRRTVDTVTVPKSFRASIWRLVTVARGGDDPCRGCAVEGSVT